LSIRTDVMHLFCYKELHDGGATAMCKREKCRSGTSFVRLRHGNVED
jgi:hypothetical protein